MLIEIFYHPMLKIQRLMLYRINHNLRGRIVFVKTRIIIIVIITYMADNLVGKTDLIASKKHIKIILSR